MTPHTDAEIELLDIQELESLVVHLATLYDQGLPCVDFDGDLVTDPQYDSLVRCLKRRDPDSAAFASGTTSPSRYEPSGDLVIHHPPMTSIEKADGTLEQKRKRHRDWIETCARELNYDLAKDEPYFAQSYKHDGVAVRIYYEKGRLVQAGLRPRNGVKGIDVTANIRFVKGVPEKLPLPLTLAVGGELECLLKDFEKVQKVLAEAGEKQRENPRNHTYGGINQSKDPTKTKEARLSFIGYQIVGFDDYAKYYTTEMERAKWCNTVLKIPFVRVMPHTVLGDRCYAQLAEMEAAVPDLQYEVDGVVLKVNNLEDQEQLGHTGGDQTKEPKGALAWKFEEEHAVAQVQQIEWNASRTGRVTPVAVFDQPVRLAGTWVSRATCSNLGWLRRIGIGVGTKVKVIKAGKIIPKVIDVVAVKVANSPHPSRCPSCDKQLEVVPGNVPNIDLVCQNQECPAKHIAGIVFYLQTVEAKGLGEAAVEKILQSGRVKELADLYCLSEQDLRACGFSEREALLALATIHMVKPQKDNAKLRSLLLKGKKPVVSAWQFFASLGVPGAGRTAGKALVDHFGSLQAISSASEGDLRKVPGIGETTAKSIHNYFSREWSKVERLAACLDLEYPKTGKLSGLNFCLSGSFDEGKSYWERQIMDLGGKVASGVSKNTSYLVAGPGSGSKSDKAHQLGVPIIDVEKLKTMI